MHLTQFVKRSKGRLEDKLIIDWWWYNNKELNDTTCVRVDCNMVLAVS